jgi:aryl-alcohol dehydrogenase-like predicted oxidoreductase
MLPKRILGKTRFEVSELSLGAWQMGGVRYGDVPKQDAFDTLQAYISNDGNFIDTAHGYDESERILGEYFQRKGGREQIYIASKSGAISPDEITHQLENSLRLLKTDYLDLYYLHSPPEDPDDMNRVLDVYEDFKIQGKIRAIGASIKGPDVTEGTVDLCRQYIQTGRVDALMVIYSIFRQKNAAIFEEAKAANIGIIPRTVLESGFLSGKYLPGHEFSGQDHRRRWGKNRLANILVQTQKLSNLVIESPYNNILQLALRFALDQEAVSSAVIGARTAQQVNEIMAVTKSPPLSSKLKEHLITNFSDKDAMFNTGN